MHILKYNTFNRLIFVFWTLAALSSCSSSEKKAEPKESEPTRSNNQIQQQLEQWQDNKLSLFVHYGVYSKLSGKWNETAVEGPAEEIWSRSGMFSDDYEKAARDFTPNQWDSETITELARDIGVRTIVFSAKHLDGFCLFDTETTRFNSLDFATFGKDVMEDMTHACENAGINLAIRFSLTDWHLPAAYPMAGHHANPVSDAHHQTNLQQIRELLTNYGPISAVHFHSGLNTPAQSRELYELVKELQPQCLVSNGIGNNFGDFISTRFNQSPAYPLNIPWQLPASLHPATLGHHEALDRKPAIEKAREKVREMVGAITSGGHYALNLGPKGNGIPAQYEEETLRHMGRWIKVNRNAIFGTKEAPFSKNPGLWHTTRKENQLYIFTDSVPASETILLQGLDNEIEEARFLGSGIELEVARKGESTHQINWTAPAMADPMNLPVIEVTCKEPVEKSGLPTKFAIESKDTLQLTHNNAQKSWSISGTDQYGFTPVVTSLDWTISSESPLQGELRFTAYEKDKNILIKAHESEKQVLLKGKKDSLIRDARTAVETGNTFRSSTFYGPMREVHINPHGKNRLQISREPWKAIGNKEKRLPPLPMASHYYYTEIESESKQQYCFEISGNEGLQVWMNQKEVHLSANNNPGEQLRKSLVLNLEKGKNVLLIKNYNRLGGKDHFTLTPKPEARWYSQTLNIPTLSGPLELTNNHRNNSFENMDLPNLSITLTLKNN